MRILHAIAVSGVILAAILPAPLPAAEPPDRFKSIRVQVNDSGNGRTFLTDEHILFMPGPVQPGKDGVVEGHRLKLFPKEYLKAALGYGCYVIYPPLRAGDVVPLFGRLYAAGTPTQEAMVFTRLLPPVEAPKGVAVAERSFVAPATRPGVADDYSLLWDNRLYPRTFGPKPGAAGAATATLEVWPPDKALAEDDVRVLGVTLEAGDILVLTTSPKMQGGAIVGKEVGMKVLAVVPPDPKTRVIGWVEFAPQALFTEKEFAKDGGRVVRPTKPGG